MSGRKDTAENKHFDFTVLAAKFLRAAAKSILPAAFLFFLIRGGFFDGLIPALTEHGNRENLVLLLAVEAFVVLLNVIRFHFSLKLAGSVSPFADIAAATICGSWVSLWLPGSAAAAEAIRIAMLCNAKHSGNGKTAGPASVAAAALIDRLTGISMMFVFSSACAVASAFSAEGATRTWFYAAAAVFGTLSVLCLSVFFIFGRRLVFFSRLASSLPGSAGKTLIRCVSCAETVFERKLKPSGFAVPAALGLLLYALMALSFKISLEITGAGGPYSVAGIAFNAMIIASLIPAGIGGFGGPQAAVMALLALMGYDAVAGAAAGAVCAAANIAVLTPAAGICIATRLIRSLISNGTPE